MKIVKTSTAAFLAGVTTLAVSLPVLASGSVNNEAQILTVQTSIQKNLISGRDANLD